MHVKNLDIYIIFIISYKITLIYFLIHWEL
jgi:hypothetical protein